jgi:hypothetical protein
MFQRFKSAIDRTIAEEQARSQTAAQSRSPSRTRSTSSRKGDGTPAQRAKARKQAADAGDAPNPDPAVFEAAFVIDDESEPSRATTPMPPAANDDSKTDNGNAQNNGSDEKNADDSKDDASSGKNQDGGADASAARPEASKSQDLIP